MAFFRNKRILAFLIGAVLILGVSIGVVYLLLDFDTLCPKKENMCINEEQPAEEEDSTKPVEKVLPHPNKEVLCQPRRQGPWCLKDTDKRFHLEPHILLFFNTSDCVSSLMLYDNDKSRDTKTYEIRNMLLTFLIFLECGRSFGLGRFGDGEISLMLGRKYSGGVDKWQVATGLGQVGKWLNQYSTYADKNDRFFYGYYRKTSKYLIAYHKAHPETKASNLAHFRQLAPHTLFAGITYRLWLYFFETRIMTRKLKYFDKVYVYCNHKARKREKIIKKWADKVFYFQDNEVVRLDKPEYAKKFKNIFLTSAKESKRTLHLFSIGPVAPAMIAMMMEVNSNSGNTYMHVGSTILKALQGRNYRAYANTKNILHSKSWRPGMTLKEYKEAKWKGDKVPTAKEDHNFAMTFISFEGCDWGSWSRRLARRAVCSWNG